MVRVQSLLLLFAACMRAAGAAPRRVTSSAAGAAAAAPPPPAPAPAACGFGQRAHSTYNGTRVAQIQHGLASVADCCKLCSENAECLHYSWHPIGSTGQPTWCALQADDGEFDPSAAPFIAGAVAPAEHQTCSSSLDCSLAGECVAGRCQCDGWTHGPQCAILNLEPIDPRSPGYRNTSGYNSWGGAPVYSSENRRWYLFASQMQGHCPLSGEWSKVSQAVRLHSESPTGPWTFDSVIVPSEAHNVKPFRSPAGEWLIFYVGAKDNITKECPTTMDEVRMGHPLPKEAAGPVFVASAATVDAPPEAWTIHGPMTDSVDWHSATNPSPVWVGSNGTVRMVVSRRWDLGGGHATKNNWIMQADNWRGPWRNITQTYAQAIDCGEDPDMFKTPRGWHMLNHNTGPGSSVLSYSLDGLKWVTPKSHPNAFNMSFSWLNGTRSAVCSRQRPQVVMSLEDGLPAWLWNGVGDCNASGMLNSPTYRTWTMAQQIGRSPSYGA
eukprot:COSAG02_NODE_2124_length_9749_cov_7.636166_5_plen_495_part_00